jgi:hypothetical protein
MRQNCSVDVKGGRCNGSFRTHAVRGFDPLDVVDGHQVVPEGSSLP